MPLDMNAVEAAWGIHRLTNAHMNQAIVRVSAERGNDPRDLRAGRLRRQRRRARARSGRRSRHPQGLDPAHRAGVLGAGAARRRLPGRQGPRDARHDGNRRPWRSWRRSTRGSRTKPTRARPRISKTCTPRSRRRPTRSSGRQACRRNVSTTCGSRSAGTRGRPGTSTCRCSGKITPKELAAIAERFHEMHYEEHTYDRRDEDVMISALRVRSRALLGKPELRKVPGSASTPKSSGTRQAYFGSGFVKAKLYDGPSIRAGQKITGPRDHRGAVHDRRGTAEVEREARQARQLRGHEW